MMREVLALVMLVCIIGGNIFLKRRLKRNIKYLLFNKQKNEDIMKVYSQNGDVANRRYCEQMIEILEIEIELVKNTNKAIDILLTIVYIVFFLSTNY